MRDVEKIRVAGIVKNSIVDGPGIRYVIFAQGCPFKCEDCHNPQTHDFAGGTLVDILEIAEEIRKDPILDGVTFSGGEPFAQFSAFAALAELLPDYNIMCYTGYTFEELYRESDAHILLSKVDILVDGRFIKSRRVLSANADVGTETYKFRGSDNQRAINAKESVKCGKAIEINL